MVECRLWFYYYLKTVLAPRQARRCELVTHLPAGAFLPASSFRRYLSTSSTGSFWNFPVSLGIMATRIFWGSAFPSKTFVMHFIPSNNASSIVRLSRYSASSISLAASPPAPIAQALYAKNAPLGSVQNNLLPFLSTPPKSIEIPNGRTPACWV